MTQSVVNKFITGSLINDHLVALRAQAGSAIDRDVVTDIVNKIENAVSGDYGLLVDRVHDYSVDPVPVYHFLNRLPRLLAIAIVAYRQASASVTAVEQSVCEKPLRIFDHVDDAVAWLERVYHQSLSTID